MEEPEKVLLGLESKTHPPNPPDSRKSWRNAEKVSWPDGDTGGGGVGIGTDLRSFLVFHRFTFCAEDPQKTEISPGETLTFLKCRDGWEVKPRKRYEMKDGFRAGVIM